MLLLASLGDKNSPAGGLCGELTELAPLGCLSMLILRGNSSVGLAGLGSMAAPNSFSCDPMQLGQHW